MTRLVLTIALGFVLVGGTGCGDSKSGQPPKEPVPIIEGGPKPAGDGGGGGGGGGAGGGGGKGPPASTAQ